MPGDCRAGAGLRNLLPAACARSSFSIPAAAPAVDLRAHYRSIWVQSIRIEVQQRTRVRIVLHCLPSRGGPSRARAHAYPRSHDTCKL